MKNEDTLTVADLERIAEKIDGMERPLDFNNCHIDLDEKEERIVAALGKVGRMSLHGEFTRLNGKIMNHHHVTLGVADGVTFRENGNAVPKSPQLNKW